MVPIRLQDRLRESVLELRGGSRGQRRADHSIPGPGPGVVGGVEAERLARAGGGDEHVYLVARGRDLGDDRDLLG